MDALLSNQLSRGLGEVANTFGQYARAAHQDRISAANEQFKQMLRDKQDAARLAQHASDQAQKASEFQQTQAQRDAQFQQTSTQRGTEFQQTAAQRAAALRETAGYHAGSLANQQQRIKVDSAKTVADKSAQLQNAQTAILQNRLKALEMHGDYTMKQKDAVTAKITSSPDYLTATPAVQQKMLQQATAPYDTIISSTQSEYQRVSDAFNRILPASDTGNSSASGASPATPAQPAAPQIRKDAQGKLWTQDASGNPVPYTPSPGGSPSASTSGASSSIPSFTGQPATDPNAPPSPPSIDPNQPPAAPMA